MSPLVRASQRPKARIEHSCQLCGRTIEPGEVYSRQRNIGDDGPYVFKACAHCDVMVALHLDEIVWDDDLGYTQGDLILWEPMTVAGARLRAQYRRRWRRLDGTLYPVPTLIDHRPATTFCPQPSGSPA